MDHITPLYYLIVFVTVGACAVLDFFAMSFNFLVRTTPVDFLRIVREK